MEQVKQVTGILDSLSAPAILWDAATGRVLHVNPPCAALLPPDGAAAGGLTLTPLPQDQPESSDLFSPADVMVSDGADLVLPLSGWLSGVPGALSGTLSGAPGAPSSAAVFLPQNGQRPPAIGTRAALKDICAPFSSVAQQQPSAGSLFQPEPAGPAFHMDGGAIESMPDLVFVKGLDKRYVSCSKPFAQFVGREAPADVIGKTTFEVLPAASAEWADRLDDLVLRTRRPSSEVHPFSFERDQPINWQRVSRAPLFDAAGELVGVIGALKSENDVVRLAEELTVAKARLAAVTDVMSYNLFMVALWNVDTLDLDYLSDSVAVLGYQPGRFHSMDDWEAIVHPDDREIFRESRKALREKKLNVDFRLEYRVMDVGGIARRLRERVSSVMSPGAHLYRSILINVTARHEEDEVLGADGAQRPLHLLDLISREMLQEYCDKAAETLGMPTFILDSEGAALTDRDGSVPLCGLLNATPRGVDLCRISEMNLNLAARDTGRGGGLVIQPCESLGLYVAAAPIMLDTRHLGTWIAGRVRVRDGVGAENIRALFQRVGGPVDQALEAFEQMPVWDAAEAERAFRQILPFAEELSGLAQRGYTLIYNTDRIGRPAAVDPDDDTLSRICAALFPGRNVPGRHSNADDPANESLAAAAQILCARFGLQRMAVFERTGHGYGVTFEYHEKGITRLSIFQPPAADMAAFVRARPGAAVQFSASDAPGQWHGLLKEAGAAHLIGAAYGHEARPGLVICFTAATRRGALTQEDLRRLHTLLSPLAAFLNARQSERKFAQATESLQSVIDNLRSAVYVVDRDSLEVLFSNQQFDGQPVAGPRGISCFRLLGRDSRCPSCALDAMEGVPEGMAYTYETNEREPGCWHNVTVTGIQWTGGRPAYLVRARDVTEEKLQQERLMYAATFDLLLDIPTIGRLSARLAELINAGRSGWLFLVDVDNVRQIMNSYGHNYSDALLKEVVYFLKETVGGPKVYRYAYETLAVLLEDESREDALAFVDKLYHRFGKLWRILDKMCYSTFSAGMVSYRKGILVPDVLRNADMSLNKAVDRVRSSFYEATGHAADSRASRLMLAGDLHAMVEAGCKEMAVFYQPIFDLRQGRVTHCEAFMRWQHPKKGLIPPLEFLDIAEHTSLIIPLSEAMMRTSVLQCRQWLDAGLEVGVSVNFSPAHSRTEGVLDAIKDALSAAKLPPGRLQFELSEDITINDRDHALRFISDLRAMGCLVAIDNFATGLSALSTVDATPVDVIKIDRDFVGDACENAYHAAVVEFAAKAAKLCGMQLTCKGVENREQLEKMRQMGADHIQGFLLSRPLPAAEATEFLKTNPVL